MRNHGPILLVEDNADEVELTLHALTEGGVVNQVVVATTGDEALDYLARVDHDQSAALPALVLLDLALPGVTGIEVLRHIRRDPRTHLLPVVVLTSSREERDRLDSYEGGANSYVCKPVDFDEFMDMARRLSRYWLMLNEPPPAPIE